MTYNRRMDRVYRPRIQANTMRDMARKMVKFRDKEMSKTAFSKYLDKDKDLKHMTRLTGSMSQHQAQKFLKTFSKKIGEHEHMDFSLFAKKHNLHTASSSGEMTDIAVKRAYQLSAQEEVALETPKGPTQKEVQEIKMQERRRKLRNLANRRLSDMRKGKETGGVASIFQKVRQKEESQAVVSATTPKKTQNNQDGAVAKKAGIRMPIMESSSGIPKQQAPQTESPIIQNPIDPDNESGSAGPFPENPAEPQAPEPPEDNKEMVDVDEDLPL